MEAKKARSFWMVGYTVLILMIGTNLPSPLYAVYKEQLNFSSGMLTLIFAVYALFIIPSLLLFGQLSDRIGRKKVLIPGLIMAALGSAVFTFATHLVWLFVARALQGIAVGMISGAASAALAELHPTQDRKISALIASVATAGGTALGPIISGVLAQYASLPTTLPYLLHLALLVPGLIGILLMPETKQAEAKGPWRPQRPSVPSQIRTPFAVSAFTAFLAWAVTALFMSLVPSYVTHLLNISNLAIAGGVVFLMLFTSSAIQIILKKLQARTAMIAGHLLLTLGLVGIVLAVPAQSVWILILSTIIAGCGQGLAFMGSLSLVNQIAPPERRGDVLSSLYVILYLGVGVPVIGVGFGAQAFGLYYSVLIFATCIGVLCLGLVALITTKLKQSLLSY